MFGLLVEWPLKTGLTVFDQKCKKKQRKIGNIFYLSFKTNVLGAQKNHHNEMVHLSTYKLCFE